jgi:hypothetical protein
MTLPRSSPDHSSAARFLFFREDGRTFGISDDPTPEDYDHARIGLHTIVRLADLHVYDRSVEWRPVAAGVIAKPDAGAHSPPFHVPLEF